MSGDIDDFRGLLAKVGNGETLTIDEAERAFDIMTSGDATPAQMGAFLMGLKVRGETAEELAGGARALRAKVQRVRAPDGAIDIVGTGGDHHGTYNVSSCSALVVAGAGVPVAKHGNRAFTSKSGAADVLGALGINLDLPIETLEKALLEAGVCFLMAPRHHSAMRNVAGPRVELAPTRTIFNLLGPMSNPALVKRQLVGVFDRRWLRPVAEALGQLGLERALVVHGQDGMDELTTTTTSWAASLEGGKVTRDRDRARGGRREARHDGRAQGRRRRRTMPRPSARCWRGEKNAFRDIVVLNSAAALMVAGKARRPEAGRGAGRRSRSTAARRARRARNTEEDLRMSDTLDQDRRRQAPATSPAARRGAPLRMSARRWRKRRRAAARLRQGAEGRHRRRPLRPDRRDQEGLAQQGPDPAGLRSAVARPRLRARRRDLPVGADRRALLPGQGRVPRRRRAPPRSCRCCARTS